MLAEHMSSNINLWTVGEVAALMRVSKMTVYRLIHGGELEAVHFGRSFRVPETAVQRYLEDVRSGVDNDRAAAGGQAGAGNVPATPIRKASPNA